MMKRPSTNWCNTERYHDTECVTWLRKWELVESWRRKSCLACLHFKKRCPSDIQANHKGLSKNQAKKFRIYVISPTLYSSLDRLSHQIEHIHWSWYSSSISDSCNVQVLLPFLLHSTDVLRRSQDEQVIVVKVWPNPQHPHFLSFPLAWWWPDNMQKGKGHDVPWNMIFWKQVWNTLTCVEGNKEVLRVSWVSSGGHLLGMLRTNATWLEVAAQAVILYPARLK